MFATNIYVNRRAVLKEKISSGIIFFMGNDESPINFSDNPYPFRQHSSFLYYFGLNRPLLAAVIDVDNKTETVFGDELTMDEIIWMGNSPSLKAQFEAIGIEEVLPTVKLYTVLKEANAAGRTIHFLPPYRPENKIKLQRLLNIRPDQFTVKSSEDLLKIVIAQREIKSKDEVEEMTKAIDLSVDMHIEAIKMAKPGMLEASISSRLTQMVLEKQCQLAYPIIGTTNGQTLHNHYYGNTLKEGDLFLLDAGAENIMHYASDLSSTFPVSKKFTSKQKDIYEITLAAHYAAVEALKPGVEFKEAHMAASKAIFCGLKSLGITKGDVNDAVSEGAHALFFPCGTGHLIGLDVHDMEDLGEVNVGYGGEAKSAQFGLKSLRLAKTLQPGFTLTVEPGIYFIPELIEWWKSENRHADFINYDKVVQYMDFGGIRNEENYLITETKSELIGTKRKPMSIDDIEQLRS